MISCYRLLCVCVVSFLLGCTALPTQPDPDATIAVRTLWKRQVITGSAGHHWYYTPALVNNTLVFAGADGRLVGVNALTGQQRWVRYTGIPFSTKLIESQGAVMIAAQDTGFYAFNASNGAPHWQHHLLTVNSAAPVVRAQHIYMQSGRRVLYAYGVRHGHLKWNTPLNNRHYLPGGLHAEQTPGPAAGEVGVAVVLQDRQLTVFDKQSGKRLAARRVGHVVRSPVWVGKLIVVAEEDDAGNDRVSAYEWPMLKTRWSRPLATHAPLLTDGRVLYVTAADGTLWQLDGKTGDVRWVQDQLQGHTLSAGAITSGSWVVGDALGYVYWVALADGAIQAVTQLSGRPIQSPPLVRGNLTFMVDIAGHAAAYSRPYL